jgi:potassium/hydrogen antiporter
MTANVTRAIASVILVILFGALLWWSGSNMASIIELSASVAPEGAVRGFVLVLTILAIGPVSVYLAELIPGVESFVLATLFGIAGQQLLLPYTSSADALFVVVNMALAVVLLHAGLETSWSNFKKLWGVITLLSTLGVVITAVGMSLSAVVIGKWFGVEVLQTVALLLGVYVASTDPAALLELFKRLKLLDKTAGVVVVSESAVNDVMGATLALKLTTLVGGLASVAGFSMLKDGYAAVLTVDSLWGCSRAPSLDGLGINS